MKDALKYTAIISPLVAFVCMVCGWIYHVETGLSQARDVTALRQDIAGLHGDNTSLRGRIGNLEQLFEPYLIEKKVKEELEKQKKANVKPSPAAALREAETWAKSQIKRGSE